MLCQTSSIFASLSDPSLILLSFFASLLPQGNKNCLSPLLLLEYCVVVSNYLELDSPCVRTTFVTCPYLYLTFYIKIHILISIFISVFSFVNRFFTQYIQITVPSSSTSFIFFPLPDSSKSTLFLSLSHQKKNKHLKSLNRKSPLGPSLWISLLPGACISACSFSSPAHLSVNCQVPCYKISETLSLYLNYIFSFKRGAIVMVIFHSNSNPN